MSESGVSDSSARAAVPSEGENLAGWPKPRLGLGFLFGRIGNLFIARRWFNVFHLLLPRFIVQLGAAFLRLPDDFSKSVLRIVKRRLLFHTNSIHATGACTPAATNVYRVQGSRLRARVPGTTPKNAEKSTPAYGRTERR